MATTRDFPYKKNAERELDVSKGGFQPVNEKQIR